MNYVELLEYIRGEQTKNVPLATLYEKHTHAMGNEYYHGYYNGYLTALFNIRGEIAKLNSAVVK